MWSSIAQEVEINIKTSTNETTKVVNLETHSLTRNREAKVAITLKLDMKTMCRTTRTRLWHESHRILCQSNSIAAKHSQWKERCIRRGGRVVYRLGQLRTNLLLKDLPVAKIQFGE